MDTATIKESIKKPFVFITYATASYTETNELNNHLIDEGINVVFDGGGLEGGANLRWFEQLILHPNCYCVLIIFDKAYLQKIKKEKGEVWNEYCYIRDHFLDSSARKYIPVLCEKVKGTDLPPLFKDRDVYDKISDWKKIASDCKHVDSETVLSIAEAEYNYDIAEHMYESRDFNSCERILANLIDTVVKNDESTPILAKSYSMLLCMYINGVLAYDDHVRKSLSALKTLTESGPISKDEVNLPRYLLNCSMVYSKNAKHPKAIMLATDALDKAREFGYTNLYYYECALSEAYKASKAYYSAKEHIEKSYDILYNDYAGCNEDDIATTMDVYLNYAEIMIAIANAAYKASHKPSKETKTSLGIAKDQIDYLESKFVEEDFDHKHHIFLIKVKLEFYRATNRIK